jgi:hypothetical protein
MKPGVMKKITVSPALVWISCVLTISLGACSSAPLLAVSNPIQESEGYSSNSDDFAQPGASPAELSVNSNHSSPDGMVVFDGAIFVASAQLITERWQAAGWRISDQPINTDTQQLPADCTLYPHQGVEDQWVGTCNGYVLIPRDGASHISVMHTAKDGTKTMVQIAPPPDHIQP